MKRATWTLRDAKAHLSEIVDAALDGFPQEIARRGDPPVVVSAKSSARKKPTLYAVLTRFRGVDVDLAPPRPNTRKTPEF